MKTLLHFSPFLLKQKQILNAVLWSISDTHSVTDCWSCMNVCTEIRKDVEGNYPFDCLSGYSKTCLSPLGRPCLRRQHRPGGRSANRICSRVLWLHVYV